MNSLAFGTAPRQLGTFGESAEVNDLRITEEEIETAARDTERQKETEHVHLYTPKRPVSVPTISLLGASISSIIMLSRVNELRFSVLDLSELKERRLGVVAVEVTDYQDNIHNGGWRGGEEEELGGGWV